jgi:hypothetical protein
VWGCGFAGQWGVDVVGSEEDSVEVFWSGFLYQIKISGCSLVLFALKTEYVIFDIGDTFPIGLGFPVAVLGLDYG